MDAERREKEMAEWLPVGQEKEKSDLWNTFDLVVETTEDQEKGRYRSKHCMRIMCAKQVLLDHNIMIFTLFTLNKQVLQRVCSNEKNIYS
jgi:hypothetical protein